MPRELVVRTPESVEIRLPLAGLGSRCAAAIYDILFQLILGIVGFFAIVLAAVGLEGFGRFFSDDGGSNLSAWAYAAIFVLLFLVFWGYYVLFEAIWNGQSPGKRLLDIRVVKDDGRPIDFFASATRNIVRIIDFLPGAYGVGTATIFFSPSYKRLGDYVAGTVVVKEYRERAPRKPGKRSKVTEPTPINRDEEGESAPLASDADLPPDLTSEIPGVSIAGIGQVTREEFEAARRFADRRSELTPAIARDLARRISNPILARLQMTPDDPDAYPYDAFLDTLVRDYLRWQDERF